VAREAGSPGGQGLPAEGSPAIPGTAPRAGGTPSDSTPSTAPLPCAAPPVINGGKTGGGGGVGRPPQNVLAAGGAGPEGAAGREARALAA